MGFNLLGDLKKVELTETDHIDLSHLLQNSEEPSQPLR